MEIPGLIKKLENLVALSTYTHMTQSAEIEK